MPSNRELANTIVDKVLQDLHGRKGVGNELDETDNDIYNDMCNTLTDKVEKLLDFNGATRNS